MKNRVLFSSVAASLIFFGVVSNGIINKRIEKANYKISVVQNFYKSFEYSLTKENQVKAQEIITTLFNNSLVNERMKEYYQIDVERRNKLNEYSYKHISEKEMSEINRLLRKQELFLKAISKDLYKDKVVRAQFDSLFKVFSTNSQFKAHYNNELIYKKLQKNPFTFFYSKKLEKKITHPKIDPQIQKKLKGFKRLHEEKPLSFKTKETKTKKAFLIKHKRK